MGLSGEQRKILQKALTDAFPNKSLLEQMVSFKLNDNLNTIAGGDNLNEIVFNLIQTAEAEGWVDKLIYAARRANPGSPSLKDKAIAAIAEAATTEQRDIKQTNPGSMGDGQQAGIGKSISQFQWFVNWVSQSSTPRQEYRNRQALLTKVKNFWVKGVLEKSLYHQVLIELGLEERPDAITNPLSEIIEIGDDSSQPLPEGTKVIDVFDQIGIGRTLLILGEPGSGKTTTLLELTRDLIARTEQDTNQLIPVVFNLSSWANKRQTITDWLVEELNTIYQVPKKIGKVLVTQQQLLPLLDGLDEVKADYRDDCIAALNTFHQKYGAELVVCSRIKDYQALSNRLNFQKAVCIRLLSLEQVCYYLDSVGDDLTGLRTLIAEDTVLQELAQSPLMLNIMTLAYQGVAVDDLPRTDVVEERRKQLFDAYIEKMFKRRKTNQRYKNVQVKHWLIWMAKRMVEESQTVFLIEKMQPSWLRNRKQKQIYWLSVGLIFGLTFGLMTGLTEGLTKGLVVGLIIWLMVRLMYGLKFGLMEGLIVGLMFGLMVGMMVGLMESLMFGLMEGLMFGLMGVLIKVLARGLMFGLMGGLMFGLMGGLMGGLMEEIKTVEMLQVNWKKILIHLLKFGLMIGLIFGLMFGLSLWFLFTLESPMQTLIFATMGGFKLEFMGWSIVWLMGGLMVGLMVGLESSEIETKISPNQGIWKSVRNAITVWLMRGLMVGLMFGLMEELIERLMFGLMEGLMERPTKELMFESIAGLIPGLTEGLMFGLMFELIAGLLNGGKACIQHFSLRLVLYRNNYIPWNYARFLDYAADRIFLQKVGGGYIFIHRMLMEHFAEMEPEN
ncbi:MAG: NACHT domain-containing protein [Moorea sp. SIO4A3]|nr:NACHT domain-containing protein [Moorena sp. SIO4A3]